ncbi:MAG: hypothetical protein AMQ22_01559 [Candidatus Methanofastidiosum methylothiophilum]|jgi:hypothetical protein|uniref:Outer membrane protein beta-barrel domain-containing protein n=1 Tax=Candidatus Methanofastidiosum methylothiophilum TaxID=1705564 RepID=A0A150IYU2_9EURY|nr:MAG: hypothetical protein AMQ22_01559 [Candidatus Methanofastidiosum methylthiophilus]
MRKTLFICLFFICSCILYSEDLSFGLSLRVPLVDHFIVHDKIKSINGFGFGGAIWDLCIQTDEYNQFVLSLSGYANISVLGSNKEQPIEFIGTVKYKRKIDKMNTIGIGFSYSHISIKDKKYDDKQIPTLYYRSISDNIGMILGYEYYISSEWLLFIQYDPMIFTFEKREQCKILYQQNLLVGPGYQFFN